MPIAAFNCWHSGASSSLQLLAQWGKQHPQCLTAQVHQALGQLLAAVCCAGFIVQNRLHLILYHAAGELELH